jgi:hypothetical protein
MGHLRVRSVPLHSSSLQELLGRSQALQARSRSLCAEAQLMTAHLRDLNDASALLIVAFTDLKMIWARTHSASEETAARVEATANFS